MEDMTQDEIRVQAAGLKHDIFEAEERLYVLQTEICRHPALIPYVKPFEGATCPDCGME